MHCCGAGCPTSAPVVIMRTLQASLDLNDDGDKVIFRQFGGESSLRTLQSGHTRSFVPTNLIPMVGSSQKSRAHVYRRPRCMDNDTSAGDHEPVSTRSCRPRQKTTSNDNGPARSHPTIFPPPHFGSRAVKKRTVLFKTMSGIYGRALNANSPGEIQRHGTLWTIELWKRLAHHMVYVRCAAFFDTLSREF